MRDTVSYGRNWIGTWSPGEAMRPRPAPLRRVLCALGAWITLTAGWAEAQTAVHSSVIVLLDASGSMKQNDPARVRVEAVHLLLALLPDGDRVNLVEFGDDVRELAPGTSILNAATRTALVEAARRCSQTDGRTDILAALTYAQNVIQQMPPEARTAFPPHVILLTDGRDDVGGGGGSRRNEIERVAGAVGGTGGVIHALGLSQEVDLDLLRSVCDRTEGHLATARSDRDLPLGFLNLSRGLANRWLLADRQAPEGLIELSLPPWSGAVTVAFFPSRSGGPSLVTVEGGRPIASSIHYCLVSLPGSGSRDLRVRVPAPGGRLLIDAQGDLIVRTEVPERVVPGLPFRARLGIAWLGGAVVGDAAFLRDAVAVLRWSGPAPTDPVILYDDGSHDDQAAGDGLFGGTALLNSSGLAPFDVRIRAPFSPRIGSSGTVEALESPVEVETPGWLSMALRSIGIGSSRLSIRNVTAVPMALTVEAKGRPVAAASLDPDGRTAVAWQPASSWFHGAAEPTVIQAQDLEQPLWRGQVTVPPRASIPGMFLGLFALIGAGFLFPRRSATRIQLSVSVTNSESGMPITGLCRLAADGRGRFESVPEPFSDPGELRPRSGIWRRGVLYRPAAWVQPAFHVRRARRHARGYLLSSGCSWSAVSNNGKATYTLKVR